MDSPTHRQNKRDSHKKSRDHSIYTQKSVRAKEALLEKKQVASSTGKAVRDSFKK